jgi:hypothetical protein
MNKFTIAFSNGTHIEGTTDVTDNDFMAQVITNLHDIEQWSFTTDIYDDCDSFYEDIKDESRPDFMDLLDEPSESEHLSPALKVLDNPKQEDDNDFLYAIVTFPEVQELQDKDWFDKECCLINDGALFDKYGSSAYFVPFNRLITKR